MRLRNPGRSATGQARQPETNDPLRFQAELDSLKANRDPCVEHVVSLLKPPHLCGIKKIPGRSRGHEYHFGERLTVLVLPALAALLASALLAALTPWLLLLLAGLLSAALLLAALAGLLILLTALSALALSALILI